MQSCLPPGTISRKNEGSIYGTKEVQPKQEEDSASIIDGIYW